MRPVRAVGLYLVFVFLGGALLAPGIYILVQTVSHFPGLQSIASKPFPRYVNRTFLILALVGLIPLLRSLGLCSWRALGLGRRPDAGRQLGRGFVFGLISLAAIVCIAVAAGARQMRHDHTWLDVFGHVANAGLAAFLVAPLEELFFRGMLFGALKKSFHWGMALVLSSGVYALVHFLERAGPVDVVSWHSGFAVLLGMIGGFADMDKLVPGFFNLALVGMILGLAYQRLGSLYFSIGLHAGWIFWLKTYGFMTVGGASAHSWFYGTGKLINGWLAFLVLAALLGWLSRTLVQEDPQLGWKERRLFQ